MGCKLALDGVRRKSALQLRRLTQRKSELLFVRFDENSLAKPPEIGDLGSFQKFRYGVSVSHDLCLRLGKRGPQISFNEHHWG